MAREMRRSGDMEYEEVGVVKAVAVVIAAAA
jgi:hypothetical protein